MLKKTLLTMLLLAGALSYAGNALAAVECCCDPLTCTFMPSALGKMAGVEKKDVPVNDCYYWEDDKSWQCDERLVCIAEIAAEEPLYALKYDLENIIVDGLCDLNLSDVACESEYVLGANHPGIATLRKFRDEVLSKSAKGKRLIHAYYRYGDELIKAFAEDPALMLFTAGILERTIARLQETQSGDQKLYADDISADIEILIDELGSIIKNQKLKKVMQQIKKDLKAKTLF